MATKNYMINDKWLDLDKQNIVELQSVDGVLDSLKVNGSEIVTPSGKITITENGTDIDIAQYALADVNVEGGGGSSDFSTAEVTISAAVPGVQCSVVSPHIITTPFDMLVADPKNYSNGDVVTVALYKGKASISASAVGGMGGITVSGDIESMGGGYYLVTGDCTITIS